jgi:hypothetical protein
MNAMGGNDLEQLALLDPVRGREPDPREWARARAHVERVLAGELDTTKTPVHRAPARRFVLGFAATAAAAVVATVVISVLPGGTERAIASWTAVPKELSGEQVLPEAKSCAKDSGRAQPAVVASDVLLAEGRGKTSLHILRRGQVLIGCLSLIPGKTTASMVVSDPASGRDRRPAPGMVTIELPSSHGNGDAQYSEYLGRVDPAVTGVDVVLPAKGVTVKTTVKDGWWAAWWPGPEGGEVDTAKVVVHTAAGSRTFSASDLYG